MAIPFKATGYGNGSIARNVFGFYTDQALSSLIRYEAYDNDKETFPEVDTLLTVSNIVIAGTTKNGSTTMISLIDTTNAAPAKIWKLIKPTAGEANPNRLKGTTSYVEQDGSILGATGRATFNMVVEVPSDGQTTDPMGFDLLVRYTYTGTAPTPIFQANEGTEGSPTWTSLTINTHGIKHCRSGSGVGNLYADIPAADFVGDEIFQGSGLDDADSGGLFTGSFAMIYEVEIDASVPSPDTFKWRATVIGGTAGSYTAGVPCSTSPTTLSNGVTITFAAVDGHTIGDKWVFTASCKDTVEGWVTAA